MSLWIAVGKRFRSKSQQIYPQDANGCPTLDTQDPAAAACVDSQRRSGARFDGRML